MASIVDAKKGKGGGYRLSRLPEQIHIGAAVRKLDGPLAPIGCASRIAYRPSQDCDDVASCWIHLLMTEVRDLAAPGTPARFTQKNTTLLAAVRRTSSANRVSIRLGQGSGCRSVADR